MIQSEPKTVVRYLVEALIHAQLKAVGKKDTENRANKPLLEDVVAFTVWIRTSCKAYIREKRKQWERTSREPDLAEPE
ncbi:hypothetical protein GN244_ATG05129 [Phytophthora infestans]|uniref:Uncharacterized protein n=1 Tax=Phytophthora infestans TaxID=4787 RepID=A0A833TG93_PHYIN|nr:hypothetical protein GN244_ATG05129 [Phytophthora infestans]KAF4147946.1 hypothetical protein GN958_ATG02908 [Phytophthora infestans]